MNIYYFYNEINTKYLLKFTFLTFNYVLETAPFSLALLSGLSAQGSQAPVYPRGVGTGRRRRLSRPHPGGALSSSALSPLPAFPFLQSRKMSLFWTVRGL